MKFKIIYGTAGTGKSKYCFKEATKKCNENQENNIVIITPEQFSFTAETRLMQNIYEEKKSKAVINAEVITFNRMAYRVLNEVLGTANTKKNLSKCGKAMLVYNILDKQKHKLKFLGKNAENIDLSINAINEFKQHGITTENLENEIKHTEEKYLKYKLEDMNLIYKSFEEQLQGKYIDETDLLTLLVENLDKTEMFKNTIFYIDEFLGFTKQEYDIIKKLIQIGKEVNITICSDSLFSSQHSETDIYYSNKITITKLFKISEELNIVPDQMELKNDYRFKTPELKHIKENLYTRQPTKYVKNVENMNIFLAKDQYAEIENVAKNITKLVRDKNYQYKEISIIAKNIEDYANLVRAIFSKYNIPVFIDEKRELSQNIFIQYVLSILEIFAKNWSYESVFNYIKTEFLPFDEEEIFKLENYCIKWGIKQNRWKKEFSINSEENKKEEIERLNEIRKQIVKPLEELKEKIEQEKTATSISKNLYNFLIEQGIEQMLETKMKKLEERGLLDLKNEYKASVQVLVDILDEINLVFGEEKISIEKYLQILKIGLQNSGLGKIPGTLDQVTLGDVDRSRSNKAKVVFILGINDGIYPSVNKNEGFLNDDDRKILKEHGIELAKGTLEKLYEDNFNIYKAFTTAEEKIYLSYISSDTEGRAQRPSSLISKIKKMFPNIKEESDVILEKHEILTKETTYEELIKNISKLKEEEINQMWYDVYKYYQKDNEWNKKLKHNLEALEYTNLPQNINKKNLQKLYGNTLTASISKLETYKKCAFSYYLKYGLKLKPKEELKIQSINTGTFMHEVIDKFFETIKQRGKDLASFAPREDEEEFQEKEQKMKQIINEIIEEKLKENKNYVFTSSKKYIILVERLKRIIYKALKYIIETLLQSDFEIAGTEIEFANNGTYKPITINLENGKKVEIIGKIDRIDIGKNEDGKYLRIIDYKSSAKDIDLNEVYAGIQIQLLTYMDAICQKEDLMPAGILYFSLLEQIIKSDKKLNKEEIEEKIRENFRMKGLILADIKVVKMQDKNLTQGQSKIIPAYIDKTGNLSTKRTKGLTKEQFELLQKYIYKTIREISNEILDGNIEIKPCNKNGITPCEYCDYKQICNFNPSLYKNNYNYINKKEKEEILEMMKKKVEKGKE